MNIEEKKKENSKIEERAFVDFIITGEEWCAESAPVVCAKFKNLHAIER